MKILVLCTGNSCRSQMAEGYLSYFLKHKYPDTNIWVYSAGIETHGLNPRAVGAMKEDNIDISGNSSDHLEKYKDHHFDYIITVCDNAAEKCPVFPEKTIRLHWPFDDPAKAQGTEEQKMFEFRRVRDEIKTKVKYWVDSL